MIQNHFKDLQQQTNLSAQECWWLLEHITKKSQAKLLLHGQLSTLEITKLEQAIYQLNLQHKPLSYILGFVPFLDLNIQVEPPILIPRVETEEWIAKIIQNFAPYKNQIKNICDVGTGSGCIALTIAKHFPNAHVTAIDINSQALKLAQKNAAFNNIRNVSFVQSDLFDQLPKNTKFDLIVSNPPYIDLQCLPSMAKQVTAWEDHQALFAQNCGLEITTKIIRNSAMFLQKNSNFPAQLIIEIDHNQHEKVLQIAAQFNWNAQAVLDGFEKWRTIWCTPLCIA